MDTKAVSCVSLHYYFVSQCAQLPRINLLYESTGLDSWLFSFVFCHHHLLYTIYSLGSEL